MNPEYMPNMNYMAFHGGNPPVAQVFHGGNPPIDDFHREANTPSDDALSEADPPANEANHERISPAQDIVGLRQQILANAELLYPILRGQIGQSSDRLSDLLGIEPKRKEKPELMVVTTGVKPQIIAHVVFKMGENASEDAPHPLLRGRGSGYQKQDSTPYGLLQGPDAKTQIEALEGLLRLSSSVLKDQWKIGVHPSMEHMKVEDGGYYYLAR